VSLAAKGRDAVQQLFARATTISADSRKEGGAEVRDENPTIVMSVVSVVLLSPVKLFVREMLYHHLQVEDVL